MKTLFVDCSYLYKHLSLNTGIQRVVRRFMENAEFIQDNHNITVHPVHISGGAFDILAPGDLYDQAKSSPATLKNRAYNYLVDIYRTGRMFVFSLSGRNRFVERLLFAPVDRFGLSFMIHRLILNPVRSLVSRKKPGESSDPFLQVQPGDLLLLLDSSWYSDIWPSVEKFRARGGRVVAVIYDLIPITHPRFCDDFLVNVFKTWFMDSLTRVDGYVAISKTVRDDLKQFLTTHQAQPMDPNRFAHFYLGADFNGKVLDRSTLRPELKTALGKRPAYIIVSTVEPRKNHEYLLDAFDLLWKKGINVSLFIIGRRGWKVDAVMDRIYGHRLFGEKLFFWQDIDDNELKYCYSRARALVFPSFAEGFGLPIIEALAHDLPVIASDIPVHREIGGERIGYCNLVDPGDLARTIQNAEEHGSDIGFGIKVPCAEDSGRWITWKESSEMLFEACVRMVQADSEIQAKENPPLSPENQNPQGSQNPLDSQNPSDSQDISENQVPLDQAVPSFEKLLDTPGDALFVQAIYRGILGRTPDARGEKMNLERLVAGISRKQIMADLIFSREARQSKAGTLVLSRMQRTRLALEVRKERILSWFKTMGRLPSLLLAQSTQIDGMTRRQYQLEDEISRLPMRLADETARMESSLRHSLGMEAKAHQCRIDQFIFEARQAIELSGKRSGHGQQPLIDGLARIAPHTLDGYYESLENQYRGSRDDILQRYASYVDLIRPLFHGDHHGDNRIHALDLGCGRGEWLEILTRHNCLARGVDESASMVAQCLAHDLDALRGDLLAYLKDQPDESLDLVSAFHVIEHLPFEAFTRLFSEMFRVLKPGGMVLLETPNPENLYVAANMFYRDPTHNHPIPRELCEHLLAFYGFTDLVYSPRHPFPKSMHLVEDSEMARRFNTLIYGPQDYLVKALKPGKRADDTQS